MEGKLDMTNDQLKNLKALAEAATPGPWAACGDQKDEPCSCGLVYGPDEHHDGDQYGPVACTNSSTITDMDGDSVFNHNPKAGADAAFIAAAHPQAVLGLIGQRDEFVTSVLFLLNCVRDYECDWNPEDLERVGEIRAAIARAEGQP